MLDCDEGGPRVTPKATPCGSVLVTPVDREGRVLQPQAAPAAQAPTHPGGILRRLTALLAVLPMRIGRHHSSGSLSVTLAADDVGMPGATVVAVEGRGLLALAQANAKRRRFYILNDHDTEPLRVKFGLGCGPGSATLVLHPGCFYDSKGYPAYTGIITCYGKRVNAQVTEVF